MSQPSSAKAICFMIMPFSTKKTGLKPGQGPETVDFDALWTKALAPAIEDAGYAPVRADQDAGALIIVEMLERLAYSDLVLADISIGNANAYYEIGVRHATRRVGCVLTGADWSRPLFDIDQMPRLIYRLSEGAITDATAAEVRKTVAAGIKGLCDGESPVFKAVPAMPDFPDEKIDLKRLRSFKKEMNAISGVVAKIRTVERLIDEVKRKEGACALCEEIESGGEVPDALRLEILRLLRDCASMDDVIAYIERFPDRLRDNPHVKEQYSLAVAKSKSRGPEEAIGHLEQLIELHGESSERRGLLGGRYKALYYQAKKEGNERAARRYLDLAIENYTLGMYADLNDYYPSCNLPRLLRARNQPGDDDLLRIVGGIVLKACERAQRFGSGDEWLKPTLLGAAFDAEDPVRASELAREVERESPAEWKLKSTIADLRQSTEQAGDPERRRALGEVLRRLNELLPEKDRLQLDGDDGGVQGESG